MSEIQKPEITVEIILSMIRKRGGGNFLPSFSREMNKWQKHNPIGFDNDGKEIPAMKKGIFLDFLI